MNRSRAVENHSQQGTTLPTAGAGGGGGGEGEGRVQDEANVGALMIRMG